MLSGRCARVGRLRMPTERRLLAVLLLLLAAGPPATLGSYRREYKNLISTTTTDSPEDKFEYDEGEDAFGVWLVGGKGLASGGEGVNTERLRICILHGKIRFTKN